MKPTINMIGLRRRNAVVKPGREWNGMEWNGTEWNEQMNGMHKKIHALLV